MRKLFRALVLIALLAAAGFFGWRTYFNKTEPKTKFITAAVDRGELASVITATGTIEPEEVIDIGAQVQGMIKEFGRDLDNPKNPIDYGSRVEKGTVLARIDESLYRAVVDQATANLHQAEANVLLAEANLRSMKSKLEQTKRDWERVQKLRNTGAVSEQDVDTALNAFETASASVYGGEAAIEREKKAVEVNRASLETAKINLNYCTIVSPVKGVIVDRRVNIGQTVVASLSAPSLFLLAKDLSRLQIWASVNEADIGQIHQDQAVSFRVATFPGERFPGKVSQIRLNATMTQNVVTYTVVVTTDNASGRLLPYLTATLDFEVGRKPSVLRVPNTALRWQPTVEQIHPQFRANDSSSENGNVPGKSGEEQKKVAAAQNRVWVVDGLYVRPVKLEIGLSDGVVSEVTKGELKEGVAVIVGETTVDSSNGSSNPFTPQLPAKK
jgi:HlyD family secretion protein